MWGKALKTSKMTTQKTIVGLCLAVVAGVFVVVFIVHTQNIFRSSYEPQQETTPTLTQNQQQQSTAGVQQQPNSDTTQETSYYYTSSYGPYSEFYYPEQCSRFAYRVPPMFKKKFVFLEALHATYPGKTLDPDCLYLVRGD